VIDLPWVDVAHSVAIESGAFECLPNLSYPPTPDVRLSSLVDIDGRGKRVLDVGCGTRPCQQFFEEQGFQYIGIDYEKRGIGPDVLADGHRLPFKDGVFDMYYSNSVYEHLTSPVTAALEAKRVLKRGGVFWGSTAFMYGFHDNASYFHMSHAGVLRGLSLPRCSATVPAAGPGRSLLISCYGCWRTPSLPSRTARGSLSARRESTGARESFTSVVESGIQQLLSSR
jgi:SAM-dependent methyltransferase